MQEIDSRADCGTRNSLGEKGYAAALVTAVSVISSPPDDMTATEPPTTAAHPYVAPAPAASSSADTTAEVGSPQPQAIAAMGELQENEDAAAVRQLVDTVFQLHLGGSVDSQPSSAGISYWGAAVITV